MFKIAVSAALVLCLMASTAMAQTSTSTSTATSTAGDVTVNTGGGSGSSSSASGSADRPVSTAYAPNLVAGFDTCMGSASAGAQGMTFGVSFGSTWHDENCERLKASRELRSLNLPDISLALLCQDVKVANAFAAAGKSCTTGTVQATSKLSAVPQATYTYETDPTFKPRY